MFLIGLAVLAILVFSGMAISSHVKLRAVSDARYLYDVALNNLRQDPSNPWLRQIALDQGRNYSSVCRDNSGVTVYDEAALKNDLDAATAGAQMSSFTPSFVPMTMSPSLSVEARLNHLTDLKAKGYITEDEFFAKRSQIINEI